MTEISFLASGSSGNCAVVRAGRTVVLLDAGLSPRRTKKRLAERGVSIDEVSALFLTHEHDDHSRAAVDLALQLEIPVYATRGTEAASGFPGPLFADVRPVRHGSEVTVGDLHVRVTRTPHDGVESCAFVFADGAGRRCGVATDLGHLSRDVVSALSGCEVIGLEANHDVDLLRGGPYPWFLKQRILSDVGHLSNDAAAEGLRSLVGPRTRRLAVLHLSAHNNTPALATRAVTAALGRIGAAVEVVTARRDAPTLWLGPGPTATGAPKGGDKRIGDEG